MEDKIITGEEYDSIVKAMRLSPQHRVHYVKECRICGDLRWVSSHINSEMKEIHISERDVDFDGYCQCCFNISIHHPDVFNWVLNVIGKHKRDSK